MINFDCTIKKFGQLGEKTGWTYIEVSQELADKMKPGNKRSFRIKGLFDDYRFEGLALIPMGGGDFILPINAEIRKKIRKGSGATIRVTMDVDEKPIQLCPELLECLQDEPTALTFFQNLPGSHQKYFSKWVESAKTLETKTRRIARTVDACVKGLRYNEMMRAIKEDKDNLLI